MNKKISVIGIGNIGIANAVFLAQKNDVYAVDIIKEKVDLINNRKSPVDNDEIESYLCSRKLMLVATIDADKAYRRADVIIITISMSYLPERNSYDTSAVEETVARALEKNKTALIVIRSTVPVGFTDSMNKKYHTERIIYVPDFLYESKPIYSKLYPSRIVIGCNGVKGEVRKKAEDFCQLLIECCEKKNIDTLFMSSIEAESVRIYTLAYLAMRVSFFNQLDTYTGKKGMNTKNIIEGIGLDPCIGKGFCNPSFGYGEHYMTKISELFAAGENDEYDYIVKAIIMANKSREEFITQQIIDLKPGVVGVYQKIGINNCINKTRSTMYGIIRKLKNTAIEVIIYRAENSVDILDDSIVIHNLQKFKDMSDIIITERMSNDLADVKEKVYTRDLNPI